MSPEWQLSPEAEHATTSTPCLNVTNHRHLLSMISPQAWTSALALSIYSLEPYVRKFGANQGRYVGGGGGRETVAIDTGSCWNLEAIIAFPTIRNLGPASRDKRMGKTFPHTRRPRQPTHFASLVWWITAMYF